QVDDGVAAVGLTVEHGVDARHAGVLRRSGEVDLGMGTARFTSPTDADAVLVERDHAFVEPGGEDDVIGRAAVVLVAVGFDDGVPGRPLVVDRHRGLSVRIDVVEPAFLAELGVVEPWGLASGAGLGWALR